MCCSEGSDGINFYFGRNDAHRKRQLNPHAGHFVPEKNYRNHTMKESHPGAKAVTVGPKQTTVKQTAIRPVLNNT